MVEITKPELRITLLNLSVCANENHRNSLPSARPLDRRLPYKLVMKQSLGSHGTWG